MRHFIILLSFLVSNNLLLAQENQFTYHDIFKLQYANDPQIDPSGNWVVYQKMGFDIMQDKSFGNLWLLKADGSSHQKLTNHTTAEFSARWSPNADRIAFVSETDQGAQIFIYWVNTGKYAKITQLPFSPKNLTWSPNGESLAFVMFVPTAAPVIAKMPPTPKGANWAGAPRITNRVYHEADGSGYLKPGFDHIFTIPANGGAYRQITTGNWHHRGPISWHPNNNSIYFSANRVTDWEYRFRNSEVYNVAVNTKKIIALTSRDGPDTEPKVSPKGNTIAYLSYADEKQAHQQRQLYLMNLDGTNKRCISQNFDRNLSDIEWSAKGDGLYFSYDDKGNGKIGFINTKGKMNVVAHNRGGTTLGRPYGSGSYSVAKNGALAYTQCSPYTPANVAIINAKHTTAIKITALNKGLLPYKTLGKVQEIWYPSSFDGRQIQAWVVYPPNYDPNKKYPLLVENHGGPILNYGDRFSIEMQLYAAAGYVVFYPNARGSTSYGEAFANLLYRNYPGQDYDDTMDGVNYCIAKGIAQEDQLYVTGGSAGGIMTAWIVGKNNRFKAAVVAKPVVNWISKTLVADNYFGYANSRYQGQPWENVAHYWKFSPLSLVGQIQTPTMVMVGMNDLRTPPSEAKQLYHALKLRKVETVLVEIPQASHGIAKRPSNLITKVAHTLAWFNTHKANEK